MLQLKNKATRYLHHNTCKSLMQSQRTGWDPL